MSLGLCFWDIYFVLSEELSTSLLSGPELLSSAIPFHVLPHLRLKAMELANYGRKTLKL